MNEKDADIFGKRAELYKLVTNLKGIRSLQHRFPLSNSLPCVFNAKWNWDGFYIP